MPVNKLIFTQLIRDYNFKELFNELGWDHVVKTETVRLSEQNYLLTAVAQKKSFVIFHCQGSNGKKIPDKNIRKSIDRLISKLYFEHLIIYTDPSHTQQIWQIAIKQDGRPINLAETTFYSNQQPELLLQKLDGLFFSIDQEDNISIVDVKTAVIKQFSTNSSKVTKKFYNEFKTHHKAFLDFILGISDKVHREWYASLMLNRLMFIYFIQKKGFLNEDLDYLRNKLKSCQEKKGKNKFYNGFYKDFLRVLFHQGLGAPGHSSELLAEIGRIPYLNGGLFDVHEIEKNPSYDIFIDDAAFERIFDFFDQYEWHLDTSISASGKDINPDVIGYIFEKYINDRSSMGAYYTQEDITDYISKNTIIPYLFDEMKLKYPVAQKPDGSVWSMVNSSHDRYIYDSVKKGVHLELPEEIEIGLDISAPGVIERRKEWNKSAPEQFALPTEIWREVIDRRKRYAEVNAKIQNGEIVEINDFITYNLNIRQFALDILQNSNDPDLIRHFYKVLSNITILDPTCGSGAFLFAALNILYPLYDTCISRMEQFVNEGSRGKYKFFEVELAKINQPEHPNTDYFIYKSIILNNLYGVDIMNEAVEIAKLRLFLKLVATVDVDYSKENMGLEPLPDIDFNIRCGNTLVGFATEKDLDFALTYSLDGVAAKSLIVEKIEIVSRAFSHFKNIQLTYGDGYMSFKGAKDDLEKRLKELNHKLNWHLSNVYGVNRAIKGEVEKWLTSHQPFHWFAEFYEIIQDRKGFDVVIGNPPYVEYSAVKKNYTIRDFKTLDSGNLYNYVIERAVNIQHDNSYNGMIIPLSAYCTDRMDIFQKFEFKHTNALYLSNYAERPSKLFEGAERNLTIAIFQKVTSNAIGNIYTTAYTKWNSSFRDHLFSNIEYISANETRIMGIIPKISSFSEKTIIKKLRSLNRNIGYYTLKTRTDHILYYRNSGGRYWKIMTNYQPKFFNEGTQGQSSRESYLFFSETQNLQTAISVLSSSLYYWYYVMHSDARTNNPSDLKDFPIDLEKIMPTIKSKLISLCNSLMLNLETNAFMQEAKYRTGNITFQQFYPQKSKQIIDEIDEVLAEHYGFTEEELDFIINYDIKYRMGKELEEENEE